MWAGLPTCLGSLICLGGGFTHWVFFFLVNCELVKRCLVTLTQDEQAATELAQIAGQFVDKEESSVDPSSSSKGDDLLAMMDDLWPCCVVLVRWSDMFIVGVLFPDNSVWWQSFCLRQNSIICHFELGSYLWLFKEGSCSLLIWKRPHISWCVSRFSSMPPFCKSQTGMYFSSLRCVNLLHLSASFFRCVWLNVISVVSDACCSVPVGSAQNRPRTQTLRQKWLNANERAQVSVKVVKCMLMCSALHLNGWQLDINITYCSNSPPNDTCDFMIPIKNLNLSVCTPLHSLFWQKKRLKNNCCSHSSLCSWCLGWNIPVNTQLESNIFSCDSFLITLTLWFFFF